MPVARPMTRVQMRTEVYARLGEVSGFFTDAQINQWLNDGVDDLALALEPLIPSATIHVVVGVGQYLLPGDLISIKLALIKSGTSWVHIEETTMEELFRQDPNWEASTSSVPTHWYWTQDRIGLFPIPSAAITDGLRIIYTCRPEEMDADTDTSGLPNFLDRAVVLYAVMRCRLKDRDEERAAVAMAEYRNEVSQGSRKLNKHRKEHAPRMFPDQNPYRRWHNRFAERVSITVT